jgi:hypothetical protein
MDKLQVFLRVFEIPPFVKPWIDRFFEEIEIDLVMRLANGPLRREEINRAFLSRFKPDPSDANSDLTTRAHRKGIINLRDDNRFEPAVPNPKQSVAVLDHTPLIYVHRY